MGEYLEALILGIVQGLTEFLPVSSSGHIEIMKYILNDDSLAQQSMMTTVFLHFATAMSTVVVFRKDVWSIFRGIFSKTSDTDRKFSFYIIVSMIPAAFIGIFFDAFIETFFYRKIVLVSCMLLLTGFLLLLSEKIAVQKKEMNVWRAFIVGISQAVAITPGISRSGATISTSLLLGIDRASAARFSFLMVVPLILGKIAKDLLSGDFVSNMPSVGYLVVGFIAAFCTGIFACTFMINIVRKAKLSWFAFYCFMVGVGFILYNML